MAREDDEDDVNPVFIEEKKKEYKHFADMSSIAH